VCALDLAPLHLPSAGDFGELGGRLLEPFPCFRDDETCRCESRAASRRIGDQTSGQRFRAAGSGLGGAYAYGFRKELRSERRTKAVASGFYFPGGNDVTPPSPPAPQVRYYIEATCSGDPGVCARVQRETGVSMRKAAPPRP